MTNLHAKTAVVTGGTRGFGRGIVEALLAEGASVVTVARSEADLAALKREVLGSLETVCGDVTDPVLAARIMARYRPALLVLNAGARGLNRPIRMHTWETFSTQFDTDVKAAFLWVREALLLPLEKGSAIFLGSSGAALRPTLVNASYASAKAAVFAFAQGVAGEARQQGIRVHCLLPVMAPETDVGREALRDFSKFLGMSEEEIMASKGHAAHCNTCHRRQGSCGYCNGGGNGRCRRLPSDRYRHCRNRRRNTPCLEENRLA